MTVDELKALPTGTFLTFCCRTTGADIYYHGLPDGAFLPATPNESQLRAIRYTVEGQYLGMEFGETNAYAVLYLTGEAAIIKERRGANRVVATERRQKTVRVPIGAIIQVKS